jgi:hypothetical protein
MDRRLARRLATLALAAVATLGCDAAVGVGVAVPMHSGWGTVYNSGYSVNGVHMPGGPAWP